jgi:transposase
MFHWTNKRIEGHIAMCFVAFTFLNYIRNTVKTLSEKQIIKALARKIHCLLIKKGCKGLSLLM